LKRLRAVGKCATSALAFFSLTWGTVMSILIHVSLAWDKHRTTVPDKAIVIHFDL